MSWGNPKSNIDRLIEHGDIQEPAMQDVGYWTITINGRMAIEFHDNDGLPVDAEEMAKATYRALKHAQYELSD